MFDKQNFGTCRVMASFLALLTDGFLSSLQGTSLRNIIRNRGEGSWGAGWGGYRRQDKHKRSIENAAAHDDKALIKMFHTKVTELMRLEALKTFNEVLEHGQIRFEQDHDKETKIFLKIKNIQNMARLKSRLRICF